MREQDWVTWLAQHAPTGMYGHDLTSADHANSVPAELNRAADFVASDLIGDDAAVLPALDAQGRSLICADMIVDGVHFLSESAPPESIGHKALAVNLSDIAAMGGQPRFAVVTLSVPRQMEWSLVERIYQGLFALAKRHHVAIVGGDTTRWSHPLTISVTVGGVTGSQVWRRSGARPGDQLFVSGELGGSLIGKHLQFEPRIDLAAWLQAHRISVHAAIDLSDGLGIDLGRLCEASRCGVRVQAAAIPISNAANDVAATSGGRPLDHALGDGEDFELLLAIPPESAQQLKASHPPVALTWIGEFTESNALLLVDEHGDATPLQPRGYDHLTEGS